MTLIILAVLLTAIWPLFPTLDLLTSHWAYRAGEDGFWMRNAWPAVGVYWGTRVMTTIIVVSLLAAIGYGLASRTTTRHSLARRAALVLFTMAVGPGLIVHGVFKDHWGRPRPVQIDEFGGPGHYVPPGVISNQCDHNCSFVSAHAAAGFVLIAGGLLWPARRRTWLWIGIGTGSMIGFVRIIQGGHFLSDVIGAFVVVWLVFAIVEKLAQRRGWLDPLPA